MSGIVALDESRHRPADRSLTRRSTLAELAIFVAAVSCWWRRLHSAMKGGETLDVDFI